MRDFLQMNRFDKSVEFLTSGLATAINNRVNLLVKNKTLRLTTILDPRFAYDKEIFMQQCWSMIEEDLKEFSKKGMCLYSLSLKLKLIS